MKSIKKRWRSITIVYLISVYLITVVTLKQPLSTYFILAGAYFAVFILTFLGTTVGVVGILLQIITRQETIVYPFYAAAYKLGTMNTTILASYGLILLRQEKAAVAKDCFERALENTTYFLTTKTLKGNTSIAQWKLGNIEEAIETYQYILDKYSKDEKSYQEEFGYSQEGVEAIVKDNPYMYPQDYTTLGYLYILNKEYDKATFYTKAAIASKEKYAAAYDNLGQIAYYQDDFELARTHFEEALELNPKLADSLYFMGLVEKAEGNTETAMGFLKKAKACKLDGLNTITYKMIDDAMKA